MTDFDTAIATIIQSSNSINKNTTRFQMLKTAEEGPEYTTFETNKRLVHMENVWNMLFQLMKHETNTLHVAFIFLFSICIYVHVKIWCKLRHHRLSSHLSST